MSLINVVFEVKLHKMMTWCHDLEKNIYWFIKKSTIYNLIRNKEVLNNLKIICIVIKNVHTIKTSDLAFQMNKDCRFIWKKKREREKRKINFLAVIATNEYKYIINITNKLQVTILYSIQAHPINNARMRTSLSFFYWSIK